MHDHKGYGDLTVLAKVFWQYKSSQAWQNCPAKISMNMVLCYAYMQILIQIVL